MILEKIKKISSRWFKVNFLNLEPYKTFKNKYFPPSRFKMVQGKINLF